MDTAIYDTYHAWDSIDQVGSPVVRATTRYKTTIRAYTRKTAEGTCAATLLDDCRSLCGPSTADRQGMPRVVHRVGK